ncbi:hypothetical protein GUJ93_ZPchr0006g43886 [Zizania palustris]|uniref:Thioredoxin domain-containing protein n=1 Tax=Zizania palustris TaxID=103762 RepID=A0A8J5T0V8_ZIZPA|nr:hypothetical protein GUJ93_ZPchr0006g43886 [Zizania palustris]
MRRKAKIFSARRRRMALARRLCRLPRLLPLAAAVSGAAAKPHLAGNPSPAPLLASFYSPSPAPSTFPSLSRHFSTTSGIPRSPSPPSCSLRGFWTGIFLVFFVLAGDSSMVVVGSAESFASILSKVEADKLPAVFYYTAVWCGPCKAMAPVIAKLSSKYPKIPVYKVDIDMDGVGNKLSNLKIFSVPTFHFYHQGQKTSEVVGADVTKLEATMESLHKQL